jgi:YVTN family beta-propeller protein
MSGLRPVTGMLGMKRLSVLFGTTATALMALVLYGGHQWAENHVTYMMGGVPAPHNCFTCHAYMSHDALVPKLLEADYLSPTDVVVSPDGGHLLVVAQDAEALLVVSSEGEVLDRIPLARKPHSVVVTRDGRHAYVTNSWSDVVSVVDLAERRVTDEIATGMSPHGLALSADERVLYVANGV